MSPDITHILLTIILILTVLVGLALLVVLALAIKTVFELFALARTVRKEVSAVSSALRMAGDGIGSKIGSVIGIAKSVAGAAKKKTTKSK